MYTEVGSDVTALAEQVIKEYLPHLEGCRIGFVFRETAKKHGEKVVWGQTGKVTERLMPFLREELDIVIELAEDIWTTELRGEQKKALIHHELLHIVETKNASWTTRGHDFEEFTDMLKIYGLWRPDLLMAGAAMKEATAQLALPFSDEPKPAGKLVAIRVPVHAQQGEIFEEEND